MLIIKSPMNKEMIIPVLGNPGGVITLAVIGKEELKLFEAGRNKERFQTHINSQLKPRFKTWPNVNMIDGNMILSETEI